MKMAATTKETLVSTASLAFIFIASVSLIVFGLNLPIYTDEISQLFGQRGMIDGTLWSLFPQCGKEAFNLPLPWLWQIPAHANFLIFSLFNHPLDYRILGLMEVFSWQVLWLLIIRRLFNLNIRQLLIAYACIWLFFVFDYSFFLLVLTRPEQTVVLIISILIALTVYAPTFKGRPIKSFSAGIVFIYCTLYLGFITPRTPILLPLLAVTSFQYAKTVCRNRYVKYAFSGFILSVTCFSFYMWIKRLACPEFPPVAAFYQTQAFPFKLLWQDPGNFIAQMLRHFSSSVLSSLSSLDTWWLHPPHRKGQTEIETSTIIFYIISFILHIYLLCKTTLFCAKWVYTRYKNSASSKRSDNSQAISIAICLLLGVFGLMTFHGTAYNFYYTALNLIILLFAGSIVFGNIAATTRHAHTIYLLLLGLGFASIINLLITFHKPEQFEHAGANAVISYAPKTFTEGLPEFMELANTCGIKPNDKHVVVDDITYLPFRYGFQPYHVHYLTSFLYIKKLDIPAFDVAKLMKFLDNHESSGIIADCRNIMPPMLPYTTQRNGFCCISRKSIQEIANGSRP